MLLYLFSVDESLVSSFLSHADRASDSMHHFMYSFREILPSLFASLGSISSLISSSDRLVSFINSSRVRKPSLSLSYSLKASIISFRVFLSGLLSLSYSLKASNCLSSLESVIVPLKMHHFMYSVIKILPSLFTLLGSNSFFSNSFLRASSGRLVSFIKSSRVIKPSLSLSYLLKSFNI